MSQDQSPTNKTTESSVEPVKAADPKADAVVSKDLARTSGSDQPSIHQPLDALRSSGTSDTPSKPSNPTTVSQTDTPKQSGAMNNKSDSNSNPKTEAKPSSPAPAAKMGSIAPVPKKANGVWTALILGLVLIAVALGLGLWWQQQRFEAVAREIATRLQQSDTQTAQASQRASQALSIATAQRELVDQLSRELSVTTNELKTLQQAWEAANEGLDQTLLVNDLKRLITMANQELVLFGNVNSAVSILSSVDSMLSTQSAPALKELQQAVITDLARLRSVPQVDVASLSARLDSLIQLTGKAPLLSLAGATASPVQKSAPVAASASQKPSAAQAPVVAEKGEQSWWSTWPDWLSWDHATGKVSQWTSEASSVLLREFADVMSIRKADDPQALLLSEEQAIQLKANVRAMLLSAQLALMTRQADIWRSELTEVQSILNTRYDNQALDTKASLTLLDELLDAPVAAAVPPMTDTLSALASAERALSTPADREPLATDVSEAQPQTDTPSESSGDSQTQSPSSPPIQPSEQVTGQATGQTAGQGN